MLDKKTAAILALLVLATVMGIGWFKQAARVEEVHDWVEYFRGYENYLDRAIYQARVSGNSMEPTLRDNDRVLWVEVNPAELMENDIIIFDHPTRPEFGRVAHRIAKIEVRENGKRWFSTDTDNPEVPPDRHWVPEEKVKGLVICVIHRR